MEHGDNLARLDPDRITSDLLANRPAAGVARRFFFATDTQKLYYDTGAAWVESSAAVASHAASHAGGGADPVTLAQSQVTNLTADLAGKAPLASPTFTGPVGGITAAMVGAPAGNGNSTGTNTGDQSTVSGNAGTATALQTARTIDGQSFNGTANITVIAPATAAAAAKTAIVDADYIPLVDTEAANVLKKTTWTSIKAFLKTYLDTLYVALAGAQTIAGVKTFSDNLVMANGKGISFAATADGSGGSNINELLDDYESGDFTATFTPAPTTPVTVTGRYTKVGRLVTVHIMFTNFSTVGAAATQIIITGLPFAANASVRSLGAVVMSGFGTAAAVADVPVSGTAVQLWNALTFTGINATAGTGNFLGITLTYAV